MATKLITYDLHRPGQDYTALHDAIKALGTWWHYMESTWLVVTPKTPNQITEVLKAHMDGNDTLLVVDVTGDTKQGLQTEDSWNWIRKHWP